MSYYKSKGDALWWHLRPNVKLKKHLRPIAFSTTATSYGLSMLCRENIGLTVGELLVKILFDAEAQHVLQTYIDKGCGECIIGETVRTQKSEWTKLEDPVNNIKSTSKTKIASYPHPKCNLKKKKYINPITYSTQSTYNDIIFYAKVNKGLTIKELMTKIKYGNEIKRVLQVYIDRKFGDYVITVEKEISGKEKIKFSEKRG